MTAEKDPRIEAVAKILFTGILFQRYPDDWDTAQADVWHDRNQCLIAANEVLQGIDTVDDGHPRDRTMDGKMSHD